MGYIPYRDERPSLAAPLLGFVCVVGVTGIALVATSVGFLEDAGPARQVSAIVYDPTSGLDGTSPGIDPIETTSVGTAITGVAPCEPPCAEADEALTVFDCIARSSQIDETGCGR